MLTGERAGAAARANEKPDQKAKISPENIVFSRLSV